MAKASDLLQRANCVKKTVVVCCCCFELLFIYLFVNLFIYFLTMGEKVNPFVPDPALKRGETGWLLRIFKNSYFIARTFRLHTQVPNALEKHLK